MRSAPGINNTFPWGTGRRFNSCAGYMTKTFGGRMQKVTVNAGFTCPNRDGTKGSGGCSFCDNSAFIPSYCTPGKPVTDQINEGIRFLSRRYKSAAGYFAYFQAYSNTYATVDRLAELFSEALSHPAVSGLVVGTRPDCIDEDKIALLKTISESHYVSVEYGVESCYDRTLERINRGHTFSDSVKAIKMTAEKGIHTGAHFILGLPGETREEMLQEAVIISGLPLNSVKFHQLQIIKGTIMEKEYLKAPHLFNLFSFEDYINFFVEFLEMFNPSIIVERFTGEAPPEMLAVKNWSGKRSDQVTSIIESRMAELDTWQGRLWQEKNMKEKPNG